METELIPLLSTNTPQKDTDAEIRLLIDLVVQNYDPDHIYCYGIRCATDSRNGCFTENASDAINHYFLLVITPNQLPPPKDGEIEQIIIHKIDCNVTIVSHSTGGVQTAVSKGNRFFNTVLRTGQRLYTKEGLEALEAPEPPDPAITLSKAEKHFNNRMPIAQGFFQAGEERYKNKEHHLAVFMFHSAVEQCCLALIRVFMGYRTDIRHLGRLLELTFSFADDPEFAFDRHDEEQKKLWRLLLNSHSELRFRDEYRIDENEAFLIMRSTHQLVGITEKLCSKKIDEMRIAAEEKNRLTRQLNIVRAHDIRPVIDYVLKTFPVDKIYRLDHAPVGNSETGLIDLIMIVSTGCKISSSDLEVCAEMITLMDPRISPLLYTYKDIEVPIKRGTLYWARVLNGENLVYDNGDGELPIPPVELYPELRANAAQEFKINFHKARAFYDGAVNYHSVGNLESAAFMLQQASELCLRGLIWSVLAQDKRTHSLKSHIKVSRKISPLVSAVFPLDSPEEERLLNVLENAYLDARYTTDFKMQEDDLLILLARVEKLHERAKLAFDWYLKSEDGGLRAEDGGLKAEDGGLKADIENLLAEV